MFLTQLREDDLKLALVGQPNLGKTTLAHILQFQYPEKISLVPDKFEIIKRDQLPEPKNVLSLKHYQRALFLFQKELEELVCLGSADKIVVCHGSTLDVLKYWPDSLESFFDEIHSTLKAETQRSDWVLQLVSPEDHDEIYPHLSKGPKNIWMRHPQYISITVEKDFNLTARKLANILLQIIEKVPYQQILESITDKSWPYSPREDNLIEKPIQN